ncbi:MAG: XkdX family protein [Lachnospiraceae bacterium]|nr:XkdX family protein [Lachnospiraceae bacterium]
MTYSNNYSKVKNWYDMGMWNITRVRNAVKMGWITEDEFKEITGEDYE